MKEKLLALLQAATTKLTPDTVKGAMRFIIWYALLLVFCCIVYVVAWLFDWYTTGNPNLVEIRNFLHEIASAPWIAVIGFIAKAFIDSNNNGIPDELESKEDK
ncbi:MAG: hypothetical protein PHQ46_11850 [Negativicutes bacterium]|nr:hypothetical protein [Negativicutes bacterium]